MASQSDFQAGLFRLLHAAYEDPTAEVCIHAADAETPIAAHLLVLRERWPELLVRAARLRFEGPGEECALKRPFIYRHIERDHLRVDADLETLKYVLSLCHGCPPTEPRDQRFYSKVEQLLDQFPIDEKGLRFLNGKSLRRYHLELMVQGFGEHDLLLKYNLLLKGAPDMAQEIRPDVLYQLHHLCQTQGVAVLQFGQLDVSEVVGLLKDDRLNVSREQMVLDLVLWYIGQRAEDATERAELATQLLPCVRANNANFESEALEAITSQAPSSDPRLKVVEPVPNTRIPTNFLIVYGGWLDRPSRLCQTLVRHQNKFADLDWLPDKNVLAYHVLVELNRCLYVIGGYNNRDYLKQMRMLRDGDAAWTDCANMWSQRCYASACTDDRRRIFVCGGYNGRRRLRSVEMFDTELGRWFKLPNMHHHRSDAAAAFYKERVVVAGGFNGESVMPFVEIYGVESRQWTEVWNMNVPRSGLSLIPFNDQLYAIGGYTQGEITDSVEVLTDTHGAWRDASKLNQKRSNFSALVYDGDLYVMGGHDGTSTTRTVEVLRRGAAAFGFGPELTVKCSAFRTCVLRHWRSVRFEGARLVSAAVRAPARDPLDAQPEPLNMPHGEEPMDLSRSEDD